MGRKKMKKTLGTFQSPHIVTLSWNKPALLRWATGVVQDRILVVYEREFPSDAPREALDNARGWLEGWVKFADARKAYNGARQAATEAEGKPAAQAAAKAAAHASLPCSLPWGDCRFRGFKAFGRLAFPARVARPKPDHLRGHVGHAVFLHGALHAQRVPRAKRRRLFEEHRLFVGRAQFGEVGVGIRGRRDQAHGTASSISFALSKYGHPVFSAA